MTKFYVKYCVVKKIVVPLPTQNEMVPWMSGLVNGLQNRPRRFDSARDLHTKPKLLPPSKGFFVICETHQPTRLL